jgi:MoaD family protein
MKVKVQYLGQVGVIVKKREEEVGVSSEATIRELMQQLSRLYGKVFDSEVFQDDGENPRDDLIVVVNGTAMRQLDFMETRLRECDTVTLLPSFPDGG